MIDFHVHLAGAGCCNSGIFLSPKFQRRYTFIAVRHMMGISKEQMVQDIDELWVRRIQKLIGESSAIDKAVGLCFDAVYSEDGVKLSDSTQMHVPNDWGLKVSQESNGTIAFGGSVHPYRKDAVAELTRLKKHSVTLIKWLPAVMGIDPASPLCDPFYVALRDLRIPLLSHTDTEKTFASLGSGWMEKNDVMRLKRPLEMGVTVIAAHAGTPSQIEDIEELARTFPNFYADTSGFFNPTRARAAVRLLRRAIDSPLKDRLLYATDWPIPVMPVFIIDVLGVSRYRAIARIANPFDRDFAIKEAFGFSRQQFEANEANLLTRLNA